MAGRGAGYGGIGQGEGDAVGVAGDMRGCGVGCTLSEDDVGEGEDGGAGGDGACG